MATKRIKVRDVIVSVHDLRPMTTREAYDVTQTHDEIHDGDVIVCLHETRHGARTIYAFMCSAWPTLLDPYDAAVIEDPTFQFHTLADFRDLYTLDGGKYLASLDASNAFVELERDTPYYDEESNLHNAKGRDL